MHRSALIPAGETQLLSGLAGGDVDQISTDGWAVFVRSAERAWMLFPEEVAYEEDDPVRDVERIAIKLVPPEKVAEATVKGLRAKRRIVWVPGTLRYVFSVLRHMPGPVWRRLPLG